MAGKLFLIKLTHTLIWAVMASCVFLVVFAGILGIINAYVWIAIVTILGDGVVLLMFKWHCPLTIIAKDYTDNRDDNFDIFLPKVLARYNKEIFTTLFVIGLALVLLRRII